MMWAALSQRRDYGVIFSAVLITALGHRVKMQLTLRCVPNACEDFGFAVQWLEDLKKADPFF